MKKSDIQIMPEYFDRYILLTDDHLSVVEALELSLKELNEAPLDKWRALGDTVYAEGKWTVRDILQHCLDTERVFVYRILAIARGDQQKMTPYDENEFAKNALANRRPLDEILEEMKLVRRATIMLFKSFTETMLMQNGHGYNGMKYGPLALGFMLAGHQRWHLKILEERYYACLPKDFEES
ncbi:MAG: DinB family protein [Cytophagales bacterium]|nr:MAG: DinB family protein [Cytophagales bacterium]TAF60024.1 MAG: DinB family protein [Cytophagales bacterium]